MDKNINTPELINQLPKKKIRHILRDPVKTAEVISLVYVSDTSEGIIRKKSGDKFLYFRKDKKVQDEKELIRIKSLVIPPAWENVWICALQNGHLQATGNDARNRKQYRYHPHWNAVRNHTKFYRMIDFGKALPAIRLQIEKDLSLNGLPPRKILATIVSLMERTNIRIGNNVYEKLYGSFGLTTLKDKHVQVEGSKLSFCFRGKKGIMHNISLKNKKLAKIVQQSKDIPGKELFQYIDENGEKHAVDSGMVNTYVKEISGSDFTAKDFRTWAGTVNAFLAFKEIGPADSPKTLKENVVRALDKVAEQLGNTRTVCKKYYVHPMMINLYESSEMEKYFKQLNEIEKDDDKATLTSEEKMIMKILEKQ